jgi:hypothetical protein
MRHLIPILLMALTSGCGMVETAGTTATLAEAEAQQAKAAKEAQARIEKGLEDAQRAAADQRKAMESATE